VTETQRVLLVGAAGQVGTVCARSVPAHVELRALARTDLDITDAARVMSAVDDFRPDLVINCAAYNAVDQAESDEATAHRVNASGPANLAAALARRPGARLLHLSTDYVFDGRASVPYAVDAPAAPLSVYGQSKLAGERAVLAALGARATIVRTAWVYSSTGSNFLRTMLRLMAKGPVRVVADQVGAPTAAGPLAEILWRFAAEQSGGVFHWSDAGAVSRYEFVVAIAEEAVAAGVLSKPEITPVPSHEFPAVARRPRYSVLDSSRTARRLGIEPLPWRQRLREVMGEIRHA
jgi:dTDP-4-dehydrorhamnose reductase